MSLEKIPLYFDKHMYVHLTISDEKFSVVKNDDSLYVGNLETESLNYLTGELELSIYYIDSSNSIICKKINFVDSTIDVIKYSNVDYTVNSLDIINFYQDSKSKQIILRLEDNSILVLDDNNNSFIFLNLQNIKDDSLNYLYIDLKSTKIVYKVDHTPKKNYIVYDEEILDFQDMFNYIHNDYFIKEDSECFSVIRNNNLKDTIMFNGVYIKGLQYESTLYIHFLENGLSNLAELNLISMKFKYVLFNKSYRIELINAFEDKIFYIKDDLFSGITFCQNNDVQKINIKSSQLNEKKFNIVNLNVENLKLIHVTKRKANRIDAIIISFHGGPESFEQLDFTRYGGLYENILASDEKNIEIIIVNYPGSISFGKKYRDLPRHKWKQHIQKMFKDLINFFCISKKLPLFLIGGSFGATIALLIDYEEYNIKKIAINPLMNLKEHYNNVPNNYKVWFKQRFSSEDFDNININRILLQNSNVETLFIKGLNDEIIVNNWDHEQIDNQKHLLYLDDGEHNSNEIERLYEIKKFINNNIDKEKI